MRTTIFIDDQLMQDTLRATGLKTKREAVELGLRTILRLSKQEAIRPAASTALMDTFRSLLDIGRPCP